MASPAYWAYRFSVLSDDLKKELILALENLPFNGFEETLDQVIAYVQGDWANEEFQSQIATICDRLSISFQRDWIPGQNWNAQWEAAFEPVQVDDFVGVRAEFHPPFQNVTYDLVIHPRMAFGTGHHATTYMMMHRMQTLNFAGKRVFDYGCGTGILAILAKKLGAAFIDAVDIEDAATENTLVNMKANDTSGIELYTGTLDAVPPTSYDIILANINRNVILASLGALYERVSLGGALLVSGILEQDRERVEETARQIGWHLQSIQTRNGWHMFHFIRL